MNIEDFGELKNKLDAMRQKNAKIDGALEMAFNKLKEKYQCNDTEEANKKINELGVLIESEEKKLDKLLDKIEKAVDWDNL